MERRKPDTDGPSTGKAASFSTAPGRQNTDRAFVVQIAPDCDTADGSLAGRVQHLTTADGGNFGSADGLVAILRRVLERDADRDRE